MSTYRINSNYAKALFMLASDNGHLDRVAEDMKFIESVMAENRELAVIMGNPVVRGDKKDAIVQALFASHICDDTKAFLSFLVRKNRSVNLQGISHHFIELYRDAKGIVLSDLVTHQPIDENARTMVTRMIEEYTGKTVELHDRTDPKMLGSFKLEFDNKMYDARIRTKIRRLRIAFAKNEYESKL